MISPLAPTSGALGILWFILWIFTSSDSPASHPRISREEREYIESHLPPPKKEVGTVRVEVCVWGGGFYVFFSNSDSEIKMYYIRTYTKYGCQVLLLALSNIAPGANLHHQIWALDANFSTSVGDNF